jgi:hypothetical protein
MFAWLNKIWSCFFKKPVVDESTGTIDNIFPPVQESQKYYFSSIVEEESAPNNDSIQENEFIAVVYKNKPIWCLFKCPCGCGYIITLPLQKPHKPKWTLSQTESRRPTLNPSVWQNKGCYSHFWIDDGKIIWCDNTGNEPWLEGD